jgi:hypothetical protein
VLADALLHAVGERLTWVFEVPLAITTRSNIEAGARC